VNIWDVVDFLVAVLRLSLPVIFASLGGFLSERSGVVHLGLEGKILFGAFTAATLAHSFGHPWLATFGACLVVGVIGLGYGALVVLAKANQVIAGTVLNLLAFGLLPFATKVLFQTTSNTPNLELKNQLGHAIFLVLFACIAIVIAFSRLTAAGLWHRTAGEAPLVLKSVGVSVKKLRLVALFFSGVLCGLAGSSLSLYLTSSYVKNMSAGRGFMALAAVILGRWHPTGAVLACLFFGLADALQIRLQGVPWFGGWTPPLQLIQSLPYLVTLAMISVFQGRNTAPASLGRN
jgi:general nucleoside transport system permease protein